MEKYTQVLEIMFRHVAVKEILKCHTTFSKFGKDTFVLLANSCIPQYSNTEIENLYYFLKEDTENQKRQLFSQDKMQKSPGLNPFDVLLEFAVYVLMEKGGIPVCSYNHLLRWRITAHRLEEDLFIASFLAYRDVFQMGKKRDLRWDLVIGTNNVSLQQIMEKGIAENHFHLKGSAPYFHLSWISMMNDIDNPAFHKILGRYDERRLNGKYSYNPAYEEESLSLMYKQAALIRLVLYMKLSGKRFILGSCSMDANMLKEYLDYRNLGKYQWNRRNMQEWFAEKYSQYRKVSFPAIIEFHKDYRENMHETVEPLSDYTQKVIVNIFGDLWLDKECLNGPGEYISLVDIMENTITSIQKIPLNKVEGLVSHKKYAQIEEDYHLEFIYKILNQPDLLEIHLREIQNLILVQRWEQSQLSGCYEMTDYAVPAEYSCEFSKQEEVYRTATAENAKNILTGERWILYQMFQKYYNQDQTMWPYMNLFYAYLVIKENIRAEMIQVNQNVGFSNFSYYESRKEDFIEGTVFEKHFLRIAVWEIIKRGNICSLETRISPKMTVAADVKSICKYDKQMDLTDEERQKVFYVYHFVKSTEKEEEINSDICCHHASLRKKVKQQALALRKVRESYPDTANRILGIDACNAEIPCRPEVFAQAFRFLRNHAVLEEESFLSEIKSSAPVLGITYHVGEDFLDVVDGLRAIDEACHFLNLKCGDRLGHALALGIDVREWYEGKGRRILITKQAYLDNLVWMFTKIREIGMIGYEDLLLYIEKEYWLFFREIYLDHISDAYVEGVLRKRREYGNIRYNEPGRFNQFAITTYYDAWKLRGDAPECYEEGFYCSYPLLDYGWDRYSINREDCIDHKIRNDFETAFLYHTYHYNPRVKLEGNKTFEAKVSDKMIQAVILVQKHMQMEIAMKGIAIETNPSSNYLIGTFKRYDKHPVVKFYNMGLTSDEKALKECPQILTSINTDDQGVFATSLENEYALMVLALERIKDENGNPMYSRERIYKWIDDIREMGIRQSFLRNRRNGD